MKKYLKFFFFPWFLRVIFFCSMHFFNFAKGLMHSKWSPFFAMSCEFTKDFFLINFGLIKKRFSRTVGLDICCKCGLRDSHPKKDYFHYLYLSYTYCHFYLMFFTYIFISLCIFYMLFHMLLKGIFLEN